MFFMTRDNQSSELYENANLCVDVGLQKQI